MSKPEDIPRGVWSWVESIQDQTYFTNETEEQYQFDCEIIAHTIMAAKAEEREACAQVALDMSNPYKGGSRGIAQEQGRAIAAAIRNAGGAE